MKKTQLNEITTILPFDKEYIKVAKREDTLWNLMDADGHLISDVWFHEIERTNDGAIITKGPENEKKDTEMRFTGISNFAKYSEVCEFLPSCVIGLISIESVERYERDGYVARAMFYGKRVYIKKDGRIFDENGKELHIMFNMVDTDRLNNAILKLNKRLCFDGNFDFSRDYPTNSGWDKIHANKVRVFGFYWIDDAYCIVWTGFNNVGLGGEVKKWTDALKIRFSAFTPKRVIDFLTEKWGTPAHQNIGAKSENYTWTFTKDKLNFIIDTLNCIE